MATPEVGQQTSIDETAIRPFRVNVPDSELAELRRRISATRWPERETVADQSQGVQLATIQALAAYWADEYDWRKIEAKLNALPNFITEIELYPAPRSWTEQAYPKLIHYNRLPKGGHFAAWEQPESFSAEVRAGFRSLR
jgi:pimeloyl-ACP methyl ester carboxylesterase